MKVNIKNKKAYFDYEVMDTYTSGVVLSGTEIKSVRMSKISFSDSYCFIEDGEVFIKNFHISQYEYGTYNNHEEKRDRKLLLNKQEINKIEKKVKEKGMTLVPLRIFINERGLAKFDIGVCKGKKNYDKRQDLKEKDLKRETERFLK